jgi:hypothetical protein
VTFNHGVEGSSPSALTNDIKGFFLFCGMRALWIRYLG